MHKRATQDTGRVFPYRGLFPLVISFLAGSVLWLSSPVASAQEPTPETPETANTPANVTPADPDQGEQADPPIMLEEVPNRAETTIAELATLLPRDSSRRTLERVGGTGGWIRSGFPVERPTVSM